jgi:hypothetical protein
VQVVAEIAVGRNDGGAGAEDDVAGEQRALFGHVPAEVIPGVARGPDRPQGGAFGLDLAALVDDFDLQAAVELVPGLLRHPQWPETALHAFDAADVVGMAVRQDDRLQLVAAVPFMQAALEQRQILRHTLPGIEQQRPAAGSDQIRVRARPGERSGILSEDDGDPLRPDRVIRHIQPDHRIGHDASRQISHVAGLAGEDAASNEEFVDLLSC